MSLESSEVRVSVLVVTVPMVVVFVMYPSLSTSSTVPLTSQVMLAMGEESTMHKNDAFPPATPLS